MLENDAVLAAMARRTSRSACPSAAPRQPETIDRGASELGIFAAVQATWNLHERAAGPRSRARTPPG